MLFVAGLMVIGCGAILWIGLRTGNKAETAAQPIVTAVVTSADPEASLAAATAAETLPDPNETEPKTSPFSTSAEPVTAAPEESEALTAADTETEPSVPEDTATEPGTEIPAADEPADSSISEDLTADIHETETSASEVSPTTEESVPGSSTTAPTAAVPTTEVPTTAPITAAPTTEVPTTAPATEIPTTAAPTTAATTTTAAPTTAAPTTEADMSLEEAKAYLIARFKQAFPGTEYLNKAQSLADSLAAAKGNANLNSALSSSGLTLNGSISVQSTQTSKSGTLRNTLQQLADRMISASSAGSANGMAVGLYGEGSQLYAAVLTVSGELLTADEVKQREEAARQHEIEQARALAASLNGQHMAAVNEILRLMNAERARVGVPSLNLKTEYQPAATVRAKELVQRFEHTRPNGQSCFTALDEKGYSYMKAGENIAMFSGASDAAAAGAKLYDLWFHSAGHYANMVSGDYTDVTMEVYFEEVNGTVYAYGVQLFTAP